MAKITAKEKERREYVKWYKLIIEDIDGDVGYKPRKKKIALQILKGRMYEIEHIHPQIFAEELALGD